MVDSLPAKWADFKWPLWVPTAIRREIERSWDESLGRSPQDWATNAKENRAPKFGELTKVTRHGAVQFITADEKTPNYIQGRYVHAWNNIGRVVPLVPKRKRASRTAYYYVSLHNGGYSGRRVGPEAK